MSHHLFTKKARGKRYVVELTMNHSGGRDVGAIAIWKRRGVGNQLPNHWDRLLLDTTLDWMKTIAVEGEAAGIARFKEICSAYGCVED